MSGQVKSGQVKYPKSSPIFIHFDSLSLKEIKAKISSKHVSKIFPGGSTLLHLAAMREDEEGPEITKYLIQALKANINIQNKQGMTPLAAALAMGLEKQVQVLLELNADVFLTPPWTPDLLNFTRAFSNPLLALQIQEQQVIQSSKNPAKTPHVFELPLSQTSLTSSSALSPTSSPTILTY